MEVIMPNSKWHIRQRSEADSTVPVKDAVNDFLASTDVKRLRPNTQEEYTYVLTVFADWCGTHALSHDRKENTWKAIKPREKHDPISLGTVNDQVVHLFLEHVKATHKPTKSTATKLSSHTLALYVKDIKRFLNWCCADEQYSEHVSLNTVMRIKKPTLENTIIETFSPEQIEALFKATDKEESEHLQVRDKAILSVLLDCGLRATELCTLTIGNISLDAKDAYVRVLGKGGKWGEVGLGESARRAVQKYIRQFRDPTIEYEFSQVKQPPQRYRQYYQQAPVIVSRTGKALTRVGLLQIIVRLGEWAHIKGVRCSCHTFRHTFSKLFMQNGGDVYKLSKLLRHASVGITENYLKDLQQSEARKGAKSVLDNLR
jgi:integrase/recombinase XerD